MQNNLRKFLFSTFFTAIVLSTVFSFSVKGQATPCDLDQQVKNELNKNKDGQLVPYTTLNSTISAPVNEKQYQCIADKYLKSPNASDRNRLIFAAISQINLYFWANERKKRHRNELFQTVINVLEVGAATAISLTNGERAKSVIADALGFLQGSRDSINKNYRLLERQALINKMVQKRAEILQGIYEKIDKPDNAYPFEQAYSDIIDYYEAGRIDSALTALLNDTGANANQALADLNKAKRSAGIKTAPSAVQIKISRENSDFLQVIIDKYESEGEIASKAAEQITAQQKIITTENKKPTPDVTIIQTAQQKIAQAQTDKKAAETAQTAEFNKLKNTFKSIDQDTVLSPLLGKLPESYPDTKDMIAQIRAKKGTIDDYGYTLLSFYGLITDESTTNSTAAERAKNILDSVK